MPDQQIPRKNLLCPDVPRWEADPSRPVIRLVDVVKRYGDRPVLNGVNLEIHTGLTTVVNGASGSGKSLLLKLMNGLTLPDEGDVFIFGENTRDLTNAKLLEMRKRITMLFQSYALLDSMTVEQNVAFPLSENTSLPWRDILDRVHELLAMLGLADASQKLPSQLSGGMKKRVSLARAVISNPEIVLFDEPTTGLDPIMVAFVDDMLKETRERFNITSVIISHDMSSTLNLSDRLAILEDGRITAQGTLREVLGPKRTPLVDIFYADVGRLEVEEAAGTGRPPQLLWPRDPNEEPVVELTGVHKNFGTQHVLRGVDLLVPRGKITTIIGGSGSGKSVIMKHIIGLMRADAGEVSVFGVPVSSLNDRELRQMRTTIGMVFQGAALLDGMTFAQNVSFPLFERGVDRKSAREQTEEVMEKLHLTEIAHRIPSEVSAGQRKRAGLARAIITKPRLIIYDEPTTGQDPVLSRTLDDMIVEAQSLFGVTSLIVSHDMPSAFRIADQIAMLHEGVIVAAESPDGLREVDDPRVRRFIYAGSDEGRAAERQLEANAAAGTQASA